jgi:hypothetical protein
LQAGHSYLISGIQFNGLSQACSYGDDATMATNYPIVQLTNNSTGVVTFCRTANHSTMAVATGAAVVSTTFTIPSGLAAGSYTLVVIANGIPSAGYVVHLGIKFIKEHKLEIKEIKEHKFEKLEIKEIKEHKHEKLEIKELEHKQLIEVVKPKDAENINFHLGGGGDPALVAALQEIHTRIDALSATVGQQRAPIPPEERPEVGEAALKHSTKKLKHSTKKSKT